MHYLVYGTDNNSSVAEPTPEMMEAMGKFIGEVMQAGALVATGALNSTGIRLRRTGGKFTTSESDSIVAKELMGGFAILKVNTQDEIIEWSKRFRDVIGDGESEIVQVFGPPD